MLEIKTMTAFDMQAELGKEPAQKAAIEAAIGDALAGHVTRLADPAFENLDKFRDAIWLVVKAAGKAGELTSKINREAKCVYLLLAAGPKVPRGRKPKGA